VRTRRPASERTSQKLDEVLAPGVTEGDARTELFKLAVRKIVEEVLDAEAAQAVGRDYYEHGAAPGAGYRNGYRRGRLRTAEGAIEYSVPQVAERAEPFVSRVRAGLAGRTAELERLAVEMFARGLSARDIEAVFRDATGASVLSRTAVSQVTERLWQEYEAFATRDLREFQVAYLFVDGVAERPHAGMPREAVLCAWGITEAGHKVLLHLAPGTKEDTASCTRPWRATAMTVLVGVMGATSISIAQGPQPAQSGRILVATDDEGLYVTDARGLQSKQLLKDSPRAAALSPHGDLVAYADKSAVRVVSLLDGQSVTLATLQRERIGGVAWSPNQKAVAYITGDVQGDLFLAAYPPGSQPPRNLGPWYQTISFSPDGKLILHPANVPWKTYQVLETVNVETGKRQVLFEAPEQRGIFTAHYSPGGSHIAFMMSQPPPPAPPADEPECGHSDLRLWVLAVGSKTPVEINLSRMQPQWTNVKDFAWSPDGKRLTVGIGTNDCDYPGSANGVFVTSLDQTVQFKLSRGEQSLRAIFSPDGKKAVFTEYTAGEWHPPCGEWHPQLMIGDLATRKLTPVANTRSADACRPPVPTAVGWR